MRTGLNSDVISPGSLQTQDRRNGPTKGYGFSKTELRTYSIHSCLHMVSPKMASNNPAPALEGDHDAQLDRTPPRPSTQQPRDGKWDKKTLVEPRITATKVPGRTSTASS
jgi:hypothetical protein